tara:strand:- start:550 stop:1110 length:561 start_codon:yes stop_codon:yes gene_type:complete
MKLDVTIDFKNGYDAITSNDSRATGEKNDCVVRAFMNAFDVPYNGAHRFVSKHFGRERRKGTSNTAGKLMKMTTKLLPNLNGKKVVHLGSHPSKGRTYRKQLLNTQYPIYKETIVDGELIKEKTYAGYTVGKFIQQHQTGTFLLLVSKHALTVKDGVMLDNENHNDSLLINQRRDQRRCEEIFQVK